MKELHNNKDEWKGEYRDILGLNSQLMDDVDSEGFEKDFKEVNKILGELNSEVNKNINFKDK